MVLAVQIPASMMGNALSQQIPNIPGWHTPAFVQPRRLFLQEETVSTDLAIQTPALTAENAKLQIGRDRNTKTSNAIVRLDLLEVSANCN